MEENNRPVHEIRMGAVKASIWKNEAKNGGSLLLRQLPHPLPGPGRKLAPLLELRPRGSAAPGEGRQRSAQLHADAGRCRPRTTRSSELLPLSPALCAGRFAVRLQGAPAPCAAARPHASGAVTGRARAIVAFARVVFRSFSHPGRWRFWQRVKNRPSARPGKNIRSGRGALWKGG